MVMSLEDLLLSSPSLRRIALLAPVVIGKMPTLFSNSRILDSSMFRISIDERLAKKYKYLCNLWYFKKRRKPENKIQ